MIGGGAAGFFAAINCAEQLSNGKVILLEKSSKLLTKVRVSGGGRCNVTHSCFDVREMVKNYPRGEKALQGAFHSFFTNDTIEWFSKRGVKLKTEEDGRMFPVTDSSQTIINCLLGEAEKNGVTVKTGTDIEKIEKIENGFNLITLSGDKIFCNKLLIATGGFPKEAGYDWIKELGHKIQKPVPSLFTFNLKSSAITELMGVSVKTAQVKVAGTKLNEIGPLLITHWGFSGPVILKLSAWGAKILAERNYTFDIMVNWLPELKQEQARILLLDLKNETSSKVVLFNPFSVIPKRLWEFLLKKADINPANKWGDVSNKQINILTERLTADNYRAEGKTTFKEEFVTCGGVDLNEVDFKTMESKICKNLFFAGEVLDIDGITGGFNFQAAWTTGFISGRNMAEGS